MEEALTVGPTAPSFDTFQVWDNFNAGNNFENNLPFSVKFLCQQKSYFSFGRGCSIHFDKVSTYRWYFQNLQNINQRSIRPPEQISNIGPNWPSMLAVLHNQNVFHRQLIKPSPGPVGPTTPRPLWASLPRSDFSHRLDFIIVTTYSLKLPFYEFSKNDHTILQRWSK